MTRLSDRTDFIPADADTEVFSGDLSLLVDLVVAPVLTDATSAGSEAECPLSAA